MPLEIFFKIAFFAIYFSFGTVMAYSSKRAKSYSSKKGKRIKMHNENEVPFPLKLRAIFGIPFYIGILIWPFVPKFMEWSSAPFSIWIRWAGLVLGILAIALNAWSHKTLGQKPGADFDPAPRLVEVPALVMEGFTRAYGIPFAWHSCCCRSCSWP